VADEPLTRTAIERDLRRILVVQAIRAALYGFGTVVLGTALAASGLSDTQVGLVFTAMLAGMALATIGIGVVGDRMGAAAPHGAARPARHLGTVFALTSSFAILVVAALTGTMSTDANESGPITSVEQAMIGQALRHPAPRLRPVQRRGLPRARSERWRRRARAFVRAVMTGARPRSDGSCSSRSGPSHAC
jgi:MFS family permease